MEPLNGINKDVCGTKLQPTTVLVYPVDCDCLCHLLNTQYCCLFLSGSLNLPPALHPHPPNPLHPPTPYHAIYDIIVTVKQVYITISKNQALQIL